MITTQSGIGSLPTAKYYPGNESVDCIPAFQHYFNSKKLPGYTVGGLHTCINTSMHSTIDFEQTTISPKSFNAVL